MIILDTNVLSSLMRRPAVGSKSVNSSTSINLGQGTRVPQAQI